MWNKIKDVIFHRVAGRAAAAGVAAGIAWISKPEVVQRLTNAGIAIDTTKLSATAMVGVTFLLALAYHFIEHKISPTTVDGTAQSTQK